LSSKKERKPETKAKREKKSDGGGELGRWKWGGDKRERELTLKPYDAKLTSGLCVGEGNKKGKDSKHNL